MKAEETVKLKSSDLRLGNWIKHAPHKHWVQSIHDTPIEVCIDILQEVYYRDNSKGEPMYLPIPLTPEILEKAGFEKVNHIHGYTFYSHEKSKICVYEHKTEYRGQSVYHVQFVHQLQNLYFALTGSELPINL